MARYKNIELDDQLTGVIRHMNAVEEYREVLQNLQMVWDNLTLLGQLSGTGTDMSGTRQAFNHLTSELLNQLGAETLKKSVLEMTAKAQVAIDILVRNLFERTADIGFLATDDDVRRHIALVNDLREDTDAEEQLAGECECLRARFTEYVAKYSVYSDIILLDTEGRVLVRLDDSITVPTTSNDVLRKSLTTNDAYVENYGYFDLLPQYERSLIYAYRVTNVNGAPIGVLCLCFRFENEMERIFANLVKPGDWSVILLLDASGTVIASSDGFHIPTGARVEPVIADEFRIVNFMGREYLATTCAAHGYQGYLGPGWHGHVMLPVQHAFNRDTSDMLQDIDTEILATVMESPTLFGDILRNIPIQADHIQQDLNRSVWNGNVRQSSAKHTLNPSFSKILLWEISNTGNRTKEVFARSIANLHETVVSAILQDSRFVASLAIDIMDRNLYERANDCRWWALTSAFREILAAPTMPDGAAEQMTGILQTINSLYTVYSNLIVFDRQGRVLAVSQADQSDLVNTTIHEDWVRHVLALPHSQGYAVSNFAETALYGNRHTYTYGAAIRSPDGQRIIGGVGIVFDSEQQFAAMLQDALPRDKSGEIPVGCFGAFVDRHGCVIASTHADYQPGSKLPVDSDFLNLANGTDHASIVLLGKHYYALGGCMSAGYREYKDSQDDYRNDVTALVFIQLCEAAAYKPHTDLQRLTMNSDRAGAGETIEIATFHVGMTWFGLRSVQVEEAIDCSGLTHIPGSSSDFAGYMMYQGDPIPVFDIHSIASATPIQKNVPGQVIVLKKDDHSHFGILIDGLGEIPEILLSRLQPLPGMFAGGNVLTETIVSTESPQKENMLLVLNVDRIADRLAAATEPSDAESEAALCMPS